MDAKALSLDYEVMLCGTILAWDILCISLSGENNKGFPAFPREAGMSYSKAANSGVSRHTLWKYIKKKIKKKKRDLKDISLCSVNKWMSIPLDADISMRFLHAVWFTSSICQYKPLLCYAGGIY